MAELGAAMTLDKPVVVVHPEPGPLAISLPRQVRTVEATGMSTDEIAATVRAELAS